MLMYIIIIIVIVNIIIYNIDCFYHAIATTLVFRDTVHDLHISTCFVDNVVTPLYTNIVSYCTVLNFLSS